MSPSIRDVAREARVSVPTVSAVISGRADAARISTDTRRRIWSIVRSLGYRPSSAARSLRSAAPETIGYLAASAGHMLLDSTSAEYMTGIAGGLRPARCRVLLLMIEDLLAADPDSPPDYLLSRHFDALAVEPPGDGRPEFEETIRSLGVPVVWLNVPASPTRISVSRDDEEASRLAVQELLALGHSRIACLHPAAEPRDERARGYFDATRAAGLAPVFLLPPARWEEGHRRFFTRPPAAVLAYNMTLAWETRRALAGLGLQVPRDVSLISANDGLAAVRDLVGISAMSRDRLGMGAVAAELLLAMLRGRAVESRVFHASLVDRGSTARAT
ncbi:MAG: LacI family DNA-binding transcriptional regulator [Planctomycetota bacterium]